MRLVTGKIRLFKMDGIDIYFHWSYLLFPFGTVLWLGWMRGQAHGVCIAFGMLIIMAVSCLFHEYCHCLAARLCSCQERISILLIPFGALALFKSLPSESPSKEFAIALAGPVGSALLGGIAWFALLALKSLPDSGVIGYDVFYLLRFFSMLNFLMAAFNIMLFIFPADGGRICRAILHGILRRGSRLDAGSAHLLATRLVVRGGWIAIPVIISVLIYADFMMPSLFIILPLLCIGGEAELFQLKESYHLLDVEPANEKSPDAIGTNI